MQNKNSMCVVATTEDGLDLVHSIRNTKPIYKGLEFKVLCYNQTMDKDQLE